MGKLRGGGGQQQHQKQRRNHQIWCRPPQPLTPLLEGPDSSSELFRQDEEEDGLIMQKETTSSSSSWDAFRHWFLRPHNNNNHLSMPMPSNKKKRRGDLRLLLGVLGCPLAPVPLLHLPSTTNIQDFPIETSSAHYIIQQYLAATGCLKQQHNKSIKNMYATGAVNMGCSETEISAGNRSNNNNNVKTIGTRRSGETGCFLVWQMSPGMWSLELSVAGNKVVAGSNGKIVWRHTPWLGTHAAKGPQRPLRRIIQGLDPKSTASLFGEAQCLGEKRMGDHDCFVLKVAADRAAVMERSEGHAEVIRHVLHGYFSQKSGLLVHMEDSHLTRVQCPGNDTVYWETTIESSIGDYRDVEGVLIAHQGRTIATVFRFGGAAMQHRRTRMEELWRIDDAVFNVPGLSIDYFIPPADIFDNLYSP